MNKRITLIYLGRKGAGTTYSIEMVKNLLEKNCLLQCILSQKIENIKEWNKLKEQYSQSLFIEYAETYTNKYSFLIKLIFGYFKYASIRTKIVKFNPDFLYIPMLTLLSCYFLPKNFPVVTTIHDIEQHLGEKNPLITFLYNKTIKQSNKIIVLSKKFIEEVHIKYKFKKQDIFVIPHANFTYYLPDNYTPTYQLHQRILFFGRIHPYKGLNVLLKAMPLIIEKIPSLQLRIAGNGKITQEEKALIQTLTPHLDLHIGWIDDKDIANLIKDTDIIILPYIEASQSGVIPLSYSFGKMVVATNVGGLSEQIFENTGILVHPNDSKELANAIIKLYEHPDTIIQMNKKAYYTAHNILTWEHSAHLLLDNTKDL